MPMAITIHEPGIYQIEGLMNGEEVYVAYDGEGNCWIERGVGAIQRLEAWLNGLGITLASERPVLQLVL